MKEENFNRILTESEKHSLMDWFDNERDNNKKKFIKFREEILDPVYSEQASNEQKEKDIQKLEDLANQINSLYISFKIHESDYIPKEEGDCFYQKSPKKVWIQ